MESYTLENCIKIVSKISNPTIRRVYTDGLIDTFHHDPKRADGTSYPDDRSMDVHLSIIASSIIRWTDSPLPKNILNLNGRPVNHWLDLSNLSHYIAYNESHYDYDKIIDYLQSKLV